MKPYVNIKEQIDSNLELRGYSELTPIQKAIMEKDKLDEMHLYQLRLALAKR